MPISNVSKPVWIQRRRHGIALTEWLIAVPLVLMIALLALQWALIWQARHAAEYAALMAARAAATEHGEAEAVQRGLAEGLGPWWGLAQNPERLLRLSEGLKAGWLDWERVWPPPTVFADFGQAALDQYGRPIRGEQALPNDNLRFRSDAPGARSGVNVQEANRIAVQLTLGVPLQVPLASALIVRVMQMVDRCSATQRLQLVTTDFATPEADTNPRAWACRMYRAPDQPGGKAGWRLPVRVVASVRMHSPLRRSAKTRADPPAPSLPLPGATRDAVDDRLGAPEVRISRPGADGGIADALLPDGDSGNGSSESPDSPGGFEPPDHHDDACAQA